MIKSLQYFSEGGTPRSRLQAFSVGYIDTLMALVAIAVFVALPYRLSGYGSGLQLVLQGNWSLVLAPLAALGAIVGRNRQSRLAVGLRLVVLSVGAGALFLGGLEQGRILSWGAAPTVIAGVLLLLAARVLAEAGAFKADTWVATVTLALAGLVLLFVFYPVARVLVATLFDSTGKLDLALTLSRLFARDVWSVDCVFANRSCGVVVNTILLGLLAGFFSTALGLAFALLATRGGIKRSAAFDALSLLPIITPPFVIALALVLMFGRSGFVTTFLFQTFGILPSRWIYGLPGILIAQVLSLAPLAYLILRGALEAISPAVEEAAQTLRARPWRVFRTVTWPLLRPAVAAAFLIAFIESLSDFGNPLVLGGSFEVLSTKIFFAVAGAQHDLGRAAALALILLALTLAAFWLQLGWLGRASYVTVTGKGHGGIPCPLPRAVRYIALAAVGPWVVLTVFVYGIIAIGGFVNDIGRGDMTVTWRHVLTAFAVEPTAGGLFFSGSAWDSFFVTVSIATIAAPLTAAVGLLSAYVLARHDFVGRRAFEFLTLISFAIPGTVIGVAYVAAFNVAPIEITGTGLILVICFVFRNMPVGVRAGIASLAQIDRSLDEASTMLRARTGTTLRRVVLPLMRPAIISTLVYAFVTAMTAVSAVIFLVTARYNMATSYIVNRVEAGEYALAITYSTVLILFMLVVVIAVQWLFGSQTRDRSTATVVVGGR